MDRVGADGKTLRHTLQVVAKMRGGRMPAEGRNPAAFPQASAHIWSWFVALNNIRRPGIDGPHPLLEEDLGWFARNRGFRWAWWELDALHRLDAEFLKANRHEPGPSNTRP